MLVIDHSLLINAEHPTGARIALERLALRSDGLGSGGEPSLQGGQLLVVEPSRVGRRCPGRAASPVEVHRGPFLDLEQVPNLRVGGQQLVDDFHLALAQHHAARWQRRSGVWLLWLWISLWTVGRG